MKREDDAAEEESDRVFTLAKDAFFISTYYRAPVISKAHKHIYKGVKICT
jgi:hypothetical protein